MGILFISNDICFEHDPSGNHPERPDRLSAVLDGLERARMGSTVTKLRAEAVEENLVLQVHEQELIHELKEISEQGGGVIDADTRMSASSWKAALVAAGAGIQAINELQNGTATSAFCAVRPPGHHATISKSMGFCLLNNVAVTAKKLSNCLLYTSPRPRDS